MWILIDSGTLDTAFRNTVTGEEQFFNYANSEFDGTYDEFVESCLEDLNDGIYDE